MKWAAGLFLWVLPLGFLAEVLGVLFQDEAFSLTAALGWGALFGSVYGLGEWAEEHVKRPLLRFEVLALGLALLLAVIAPVLRGHAVDPIPALFVAVGLAAVFVGLGPLLERFDPWAENYRRRHPSL